MTLWDQLQSLQGEHQAQIAELFGKYSLELEVQSHLGAWLETQPWGEVLDSNDQRQVSAAGQLLTDLVQALSQKATQVASVQTIEAMIEFRKLTDTANSIEAKYRPDPTSLSNLMNQLLITEHQMITLSQQQMMDGMEGTEQFVQQSQFIGEMLQYDTQKMEQVVKQLEHQKEHYVIQFEERRNSIALLETKYKEIENSSQPEQTKDELMKHCKCDMEKMWSSVKQMAENLLGRRNDAIEQLNQQLERFKEYQNTVLGEIINWKYSQKLSLCGFPEPEPLDEIKKHCESLAELEWRGYTHTTQVENLFLQVLQNNRTELNRMTVIKNAYKELLTKLIEEAFVIEKQPPQILKTQTKFTTTVRHLIGSKLNMQMNKPEVTATIITEKQAKELCNGGRWQSQGENEILNNKKAMEYVPQDDSVVAEFKNMSLKKANRQGKKSTERVMDEKSTLVFQAELYIGGEKFPVMQLSLPVSVIVHGNQQPEAEGTIFWDNAFSQIERIPFEVPPSVLWREFTVALNARWILANLKALDEDHLDYLGSKLYGERPSDGYLSNVVKKEDFNKDNLRDRQFTFWSWFYQSMDLVKKNFCKEWQESLVKGFISKEKAREILLQQPVGTFLLRFSDGVLGGISVAYVAIEQGDHDVFNIEPWSYKDLSRRSLSDRIKDLSNLQQLYPNIPKDDAFGKFYSRAEAKEMSTQHYIPSILHCTIDRPSGDINIGSPLSVSSQDCSMDPSSPLEHEMFLSNSLQSGITDEQQIDFDSILLPGLDPTLSLIDLNTIEQVLDSFGSINMIEGNTT